jgi:hypothetical protein
MVDEILIDDITENEWCESADNEPDREWAHALTDETEDIEC